MDEEESFARLLSASTPAPRPSLYASASDADPWGNPFGEDAGWGGSESMVLPTPAAPARSPSPELDSEPETAHYAATGVDERPDPPSVIAAREREELAALSASAASMAAASGGGAGFQSPGFAQFDDPYASGPGWSPPGSKFASQPLSQQQQQQQQQASQPSSPTVPKPRSPTTSTGARAPIPAGLIDEDLLTERDARTSLTRAFVKSDPAPAAPAPAAVQTPEKKAYVFKPKAAEPAPVASPAKEKEVKEAKKAEVEAEGAEEAKEAPKEKDQEKEKEEKTAEEGEKEDTTEAAEFNVAETDATNDEGEDTPTDAAATPTATQPGLSALAHLAPTSIPLPESTAGTPSVSRPDTPGQRGTSLNAPTPADRVSVSPLETPASDANVDYCFRSLAIGASGATLPAAPLGSPPTSARFGGRGWGAVESEPLASDGADPWGNNAASGWGEPPALGGIPTLDRSESREHEDGSETQSPPPEDAEADDDAPPLSAMSSGTASGRIGSPRRSKLLSTPVFQISVADPTKVGDPVRGHVVYTVRTRTTSPHYRRGDFSVLRRFSDFLWLFEQLSANNPGVIVPPVPDKQPFGRFQDQFIETRRAALQRCLTKMTAHPILQLDPDLRLFLESDSFALDVKNRRMAPVDGATTPSTGGFMSSWTGPRYVEQDEWFDQRKTYLDHLEGQLKGVSKALDVASKARLEMALSIGEFADAAQVLADSDLGAAMCAALARLADLSRKERQAGEDQAKADVTQLLNLTDEYVRFISSVRLAFGSRVRAYHSAQAAEKEVVRIRKQREKDRAAGRLGDRAASSMAEVQEAERRARDANVDFDGQTKLVKAEFARFERERVDEFRRTLTQHLDDQITRQAALVTAWEEYHALLLRMVQRAQGGGE